jgi:sugar (pentulose or hexulose) kinase
MASHILVKMDGQPVTPIISWQDQRALAVGPQLMRSSYHFLRDKLDQVGYQRWDGLRPGLPLIYLKQILEPGLDTSGMRVLSLNQFALLTLDSSLEVDQIPIHSSEAAATGLLNPWTLRWDEDALQFLGVPSTLFSDVVENYIPVLKSRGAGPEIMVPVGDFQAAILGSDLQRSETFVHIATGGQVARIVHSPEVEDLTIQIRPTLDNNGVVACRTHLPAGRLLGSVAKILGQVGNLDAWRQIDGWLEEEVPQRFDFSHDDTSVFNLFGLATAGLNMDEVLKSVVRGVFEVYVSTINSLVPHHKPELVFSGGTLTKLPTFMRELRDRTGADHSRSVNDSDSSLRGLARLLDLGDLNCDQ